jgi:hypothetical protein
MADPMDPFGADVTNAVRSGRMSPAEAATMVSGYSFKKPTSESRRIKWI